jgi:hypothetical protein
MPMPLRKKDRRKKDRTAITLIDSKRRLKLQQYPVGNYFKNKVPNDECSIHHSAFPPSVEVRSRAKSIAGMTDSFILAFGHRANKLALQLKAADSRLIMAVNYYVYKKNSSV